MRVAVAMSGGVDSSVAALLLARDGAEVVGLSMHLWNHDRDGTGAAVGRCCTLDDLSTARRAAEKIGIPHFVLDLTEGFLEAVVRPFVLGYLEGFTPIPCTACNTDVKFRSLLARAEALGCERVATGHYARLERDEATGEIRLLKALDDSRDQSYYLYDLTPSQLARALFPLGGLLKRDVRRLAREAGLPNWNKPDSQEICFVPAAEGPAGFIRKEAEALGVPLPAFAGSRPGPITDTCGRVVGRHDGTFSFTVGQRRGLGLAAGRPLYVLEVIPEEGRVVVGEEKDLYSRTIAIRNLNLLVPPPPAGTLPVLARVRSRQPEKPALLVLEGERVRLVFEEPVRAPAPGQSAVFFDRSRPERLLGGGVIGRSGSTRS